MESIAIAKLFGAITRLEESLRVESFIDLRRIVTNVSFALLVFAGGLGSDTDLENIEGALTRISPSTSFTSTPGTAGPTEH